MDNRNKMSKNELAHDYNLRSTPAVGRYQLRSIQGQKLLPGVDAGLPSGARRIKPLKKRSHTSPPPAAIPLYYIPGDIASNVQAVNHAEVALSFPLTALNRTQRLVWGLPANASSLLVRLKFASAKSTTESQLAPTVGFCAYFLHADAYYPAGPHIYRYAGRPWSNAGLTCGGTANILTYVAVRELYLFFGAEKAVDPDSQILQLVHDKISAIVTERSPANKCIVCRKDLGVSLKMYRAAACRNETCQETIDGAPLSVRLSPILLDPSALDFLLCTLYALARPFDTDDSKEADELGYTTEPRPKRLPVPAGLAVKKPLGKFVESATGANAWRERVLPGCSLRWSDIRATLDTFPKLESVKSLPDLINGADHHLRHNDETGDDNEKEESVDRRRRRMLLSWLINQFRGCMISAPQNATVKAIPTAASFMMLSSSLDHYEGFSAKLCQKKADSNESALGGWAVFHGAPPIALFSILRGGLRDMSRRPNENPVNRPAAPGIFCSDLIHYSYWYALKHITPLATWENSRWPSHLAVVFGCELAQSKEPIFKNLEYAFADEASVTLRHVFVLDPRQKLWSPTVQLYSGHDVPSAEATRPVMEEMYRQLHAGQLLGDA